MSKRRFDVSYGGSFLKPYCFIDFHHCREWDIDENGKEVGCYGTNQNHGFTFAEAKKCVSEWHRRQMNSWKTMTEAEWMGSFCPSEKEKPKDLGS